jgi:hypothetical protein
MGGWRAGAKRKPRRGPTTEPKERGRGRGEGAGATSELTLCSHTALFATDVADARGNSAKFEPTAAKNVL